MGSTSTGTGVSGGDEIAEKVKFIQLTYIPKLGTLLAKIQEKLDQGENEYLQQCRRDITWLQNKLRIAKAEYSIYDMNQLVSLEQHSREFIDSRELSGALTQKLQVADVNQGPSFVNPSFILPPPTPIKGSHSAPLAMHRTENISVDNAVYGYHPNQKTDPPPRNTQDGLNTSSHAAASSVMGVASGTQDYSGYASYSTFYDPYGYETIGYQDYHYGYPHQANQPYTPQIGGPQNSESPFQPLTSFQKSGSYPGSASYSTIYCNIGDYQTSGGLASSDYGSQTMQANLCNDFSDAKYPSHQYSDYTPADTSSVQRSSTVAPTADYYSQTPSGVICAPGTEKKYTTSVSSHDSQTTHLHILNNPLTPSLISDILRRFISHTQPSSGTTSWQPQVESSDTTSWNPPRSSSGMASWRPESISSATTSWKQIPTSWKPEPTPSNTTSWRPESTSSSTISWGSEPTLSNSTSWKSVPPSTSWKPNLPSTSWRPEPTPSSTTSWRPEPTSTSTISWRPEPSSSGLLTVQSPNAAFQNYPVSNPPSHFQNPFDSNPVHYGNSHVLQQTACSQGPTSNFPATHPGAQTYTPLLQSGSSMDTRRENTLQVVMNPSILHILDDDEAEEALSRITREEILEDEVHVNNIRRSSSLCVLY